MDSWLGHRDLCPLQWGQPCECSCSKPTCVGVDRCHDPECPVAALFESTEDPEGSTP